MSFRKDLNTGPAAACWDYEEIPLSVLVQACLREGERKRIAQDARGRLWGLRSNPPLSEDARRQTWAFEVGERSEVGVLESILKRSRSEPLSQLCCH